MVAVYNIGVCAMNFRSNEKRPDYTWSKLAQELLQYLYNKTGLVFIQEAGPVDMKACAPQLLANLVAIRGGQEPAQTRRHPVWSQDALFSGRQHRPRPFINACTQRAGQNQQDLLRLARHLPVPTTTGSMRASGDDGVRAQQVLSSLVGFSAGEHSPSEHLSVAFRIEARVCSSSGSSASCHVG